MSDTVDHMASTDDALLERYPANAPQSQLVWTAIVEVGATIDLGPAPTGHRYMVPILGGRVVAGPAGTGLNGVVLSGGADRQLMRSDGVKELEAIYEMQMEGGTVLSICNKVLVDTAQKPDRYVMSVIEVTAPDGPFAWLNRRLIVGTLDSARPELPYVIIRGWCMA